MIQASGIKDFDYKSNKDLQLSLNRVDKADDPFFNKLLESRAWATDVCMLFLTWFSSKS